MLPKSLSTHFSTQLVPSDFFHISLSPSSTQLLPLIFSPAVPVQIEKESFVLPPDPLQSIVVRVFASAYIRKPFSPPDYSTLHHSTHHSPEITEATNHHTQQGLPSPPRGLVRAFFYSGQQGGVHLLIGDKVKAPFGGLERNPCWGRTATFFSSVIPVRSRWPVGVADPVLG